MVGYTESLTDPSYEGQILVLTYPLIGNYGVPARPENFLDALPLEFESSRIHIAGLVIGYYTEDFSHFLAKSSLGEWLKEITKWESTYPYSMPTPYDLPERGKSHHWYHVDQYLLSSHS